MARYLRSEQLHPNPELSNLPLVMTTQTSLNNTRLRAANSLHGWRLWDRTYAAFVSHQATIRRMVRLALLPPTIAEFERDNPTLA